MQKMVIDCSTGVAQAIEMTEEEVAARLAEIAAREAEIAEAIANEPVETPAGETADLPERVKLLEARIAALEKNKKE